MTTSLKFKQNYYEKRNDKNQKVIKVKYNKQENAY